MRLLLLLSAILTALTGVIGPRASAAQPVTASATADVTCAERVAVASPLASAVVRWSRRAMPRFAPAEVSSPARARPLYADRRRE